MSLLANSNAIETGGYQISRSVRLRSSASATFSRTPASAGNRKTFTFSFWSKLSIITNWGIMFGAGDGNTSTSSYLFYYQDKLGFYWGGTGGPQWRTTAVYRDPSAWYHIVCAIDTTQATFGNRLRLYINGVEVTSWSTQESGGLSNQNSDLYINNTQEHGIGNEPPSTGTAYPTDMYVAEFNFIDGQALTPSSFGQTDANTGVWVAKKYVGSYGTNGFFLTFADNSAATSTTIGKDYSGNGNNWTPNNISVTAGSTYDSMLDVPSGNGYADGGNGRGNYATLNPLENTGNTLSAANLTATSGSNWYNTKSTIGMLSGKWYCEFVHTTAVNYTQVGVFKTESPLSTSTYFSVSANGWSYSAAFGELRNNDVPTTSGISTSAVGDIINIAVDVDAGKLWFGKNGTWFNSGNPASGTNAAYTNLSGGMSFVVGTNSTAVINANFGQRPFSYTPPTGFKALNTTNLPTPTIGATSTTQAGKYMNAVLYTGTGSSNAQTGVGFQPDLVWIKSRSGATDHGWYDAVRGVQKQLESNTTTAETTETTGLTAFGSDGFTVGALAQLNTSSATYVAWNWKANGTGSTNTAGTITSTVSANTTSGFSIATTTGTGGTGTIGHGLGAVPQFIMCFRRNTAADHYCYHQAIGNTNFLILNSTAASAASANLWNNTTPTSTVFSVGNTNNNSGDTYVHYIFAPISGYSAFGSYTGNGSTDGIFIYLGFKPRFIMIKRTDTTADWVIYDSARDTYNVNTLTLYPNLSSAEGVVNPANDFLSNGFKARNLTSTFNASGGTYIYAAFGDAFKFSNAR